MNIYNFIFCYFYQKNGTDIGGRIFGSGMLFFTIMMHFFLLDEVIMIMTNKKIFAFFTAIRQDNKFLFPGLMISTLFFFYSSKRMLILMKHFEERDEDIQRGDTNRIILYIVVPFILTIVAVAIRQKIYGV